MRRPRIGQYRHRPGSEVYRGADGTVHVRGGRRRFPYTGIVFVLSASAGPLLCAGASLLLRAVGLTDLLPERVSNRPLPPAPSPDNLLFGAALPETVLACGLAGWWVWRSLWKSPQAPGAAEAGVGSAFRSLLGHGLVLGSAAALAAIPIGIAGLYLRTAPPGQPWAVRPFFAALAALVGTANVVVTGIVPLVVLLLGLALGAAAALGVALLWRRYPEEPL